MENPGQSVFTWVPLNFKKEFVAILHKLLRESRKRGGMPHLLRESSLRRVEPGVYSIWETLFRKKTCKCIKCQIKVDIDFEGEKYHKKLQILWGWKRPPTLQQPGKRHTVFINQTAVSSNIFGIISSSITSSDDKDFILSFSMVRVQRSFRVSSAFVDWNYFWFLIV